MIRLRIKKRRKAEKLMIQYPRKLKFSQNVAGLYGWNGGRGGRVRGEEKKRSRKFLGIWLLDKQLKGLLIAFEIYIALLWDFQSAEQIRERVKERKKENVWESDFPCENIFTTRFLGFVPFLSFCISIFILIHEANSSFPFCLFFSPSFFQ